MKTLKNKKPKRMKIKKFKRPTKEILRSQAKNRN